MYLSQNTENFLATSELLNGVGTYNIDVSIHGVYAGWWTKHTPGFEPVKLLPLGLLSILLVPALEYFSAVYLISQSNTTDNLATSDCSGKTRIKGIGFRGCLYFHH